MILCFPNFDTFRLALSSSVVPTNVTSAPATVSYGDQGEVYLEPAEHLSQPALRKLNKIGVKASRRHAADPQQVLCWPQALPLTRDSGPLVAGVHTPVLFELADASDLPGLVNELLRLGNDRIGLRWLGSAGENEPQRVLLRVVGPPYYTLLSAVDRSLSNTRSEVWAYVERAPRVWVQVGYQHPLAEQIRVPEQQMLFLRSPRQWVLIDDGPYQDVYEVARFELPAVPVTWTGVRSEQRIAVPLRLIPGQSIDPSQLWVIRENAVEQLDTLACEASDQSLEQFDFAIVSDAEGRRTAVLRVRPSKESPPQLALDRAIGFRLYPSFRNLYVPIGRRLEPSLRPNVVANLLAKDPDKVVWLYPTEDGGFVPESMPDSAFRRLSDWVDYVIRSEERVLSDWVASTCFDFEGFVCVEESAPPSQRQPHPPSRSAATSLPIPTTPEPELPKSLPNRRSRAQAASAPVAASPLPPVAESPTKQKLEDVRKWREELERRFFSIEGGLDARDRVQLWPELAQVNAQLGEINEAAICWLNAMWHEKPIRAESLQGWLSIERQESSTLTPGAFDRMLGRTDLSGAELRATTATILYLLARQPRPDWLGSRLQAVQAFMERHEPLLPVRAVWLIAYHLCQWNRPDVLGLARVRDRLLFRLLHSGLSPERDLPSFLRYAGQSESERVRLIRQQLPRLREVVQRWSEPFPNKPYNDLLFAFAHARLGDKDLPRQILEEVRQEIVVPPPSRQRRDYHLLAIRAISSRFLYGAFRYRIEQALEGRPHTGPLPESLLQQLNDIQRRGSQGDPNNPYRMAHYVILRMIEQSYVLEPHERHDPYAAYVARADTLRRELATLHQIRDGDRLRRHVLSLLHEGVTARPAAETEIHVLCEALPLSPRVGEVFTLDLLRRAAEVLNRCRYERSSDARNRMPQEAHTGPSDTVFQQGRLLERALLMAGLYDHSDIAQQLVDNFVRLARSYPMDARFRLINLVAGQCLRSLRRMSSQEEVSQFLQRLNDEVLEGMSLEQCRRQYAHDETLWASGLQTLVNLSGGWLMLGQQSRAQPVLDMARRELLERGQEYHRSNRVPDYVNLAKAYIMALGNGQVTNTMPYLVELFERTDSNWITNTWTTAPYYSRFHFNLAECVIRALIRDEFALGGIDRNWIDSDDLIVRRRIHADMRALLEQHP